MASIGRRRGNKEDKEILDILSYECRAALHRCYSTVWDELVEHLRDRHGLPEESVEFHRFWHRLHLWEANETDQAYFHLFHGHIFALHPACGNFMLTNTGRELIGAWLRHPEFDSETGQRLLHGLSVAVHHYAQRNNVYKLLRKKEPTFVGGQDLVALEGEQEERRRGWRRTKPRKTDAR